MLEKQIQELLSLRLKSDTGKWATYQSARRNWSAMERSRLRSQLNEYVRVEDHKALEKDHKALKKDHKILVRMQREDHAALIRLLQRGGILPQT